MRRQFTAVLAVLALVVGACGDSGGDSAACGAIADDAIDLIQGFIDQVDEMALEVLADESFITGFDASVEELVDRAEAAACKGEQMEQLFEERVGDLRSESDFGQLFIDEYMLQDPFSE